MSSSGESGGRCAPKSSAYFPELVKALEVACEADQTRYGDCPKCKTRVAVTFPDIQGRVKALKFIVEAGFGKTPETIDVRVGFEADLERWKGYLERMTEEERSVMQGFLTRIAALQPALPVGTGREGKNGDEGS